MIEIIMIILIILFFISVIMILVDTIRDNENVFIWALIAKIINIILLALYFIRCIERFGGLNG